MFLIVFLVISLAGCATTKKGYDTQTQQLHSRINFLEEELQRKNQEVSDLENELARTQDASSLSRSTKESSIGSLSPKQIQKALKNSGFYNGPIDGKIGSKTKKAIKDFQKVNGLKADGVVGKRTAEKLNDYLTR
jgi:peptidoglycan hydrolase-like protein with peptidoglycan-binding domain